MKVGIALIFIGLGLAVVTGVLRDRPEAGIFTLLSIVSLLCAGLVFSKHDWGKEKKE